MALPETASSLPYLPPIAYFIPLLSQPKLFLKLYDFPVKKTACTQTSIAHSQGKQKLILPVHDSSRTSLKQAQIDQPQKVLQKHQRALRTAYGKAAFFENYSPLITPHYEKNPKMLWQLNLDLLKTCLHLLGMHQIQLVLLNNPSELPSSLREQPLDSSNHQLDKYPYRQVFSPPFLPNLSILDLLFCLGPESLTYLKRVADSMIDAV